LAWHQKEEDQNHPNRKWDKTKSCSEEGSREGDRMEEVGNTIKVVWK
jgi:hypothetical protein